MKKTLIILLFSLSTIPLTACQAVNPFLTEDGPVEDGLYRSSDRGETWRYLSAETSLLPVLPTVIAPDPTVPNVLYVGMGGAGLYKSWDSGNSWQSLNAGIPAQLTALVRKIVFHPGDSNTLFLVGEFDQRGAVVKGVNGGENWEQLYVELPVSSEITDFAIDNIDTNKYFAIGQARAFLISEDAGESWSARYWFQGDPGHMAINPELPQVFWVGESRNGILKSTDEGRTWQEVGNRSIPREINAITFNPNRNSGVYLTTNDGIFYSDSEGEIWEMITETLPVRQQEISSISFHPDDPDQFSLVIGNNLYTTRNHGNSWQVQEIGIEANAVNLLVNPHNPETIYVGAGESR